MPTPKNKVKLGYDVANVRFKKMVNGKTFLSSRGLLPSDHAKAVAEFLDWMAKQEERPQEVLPAPAETWQEYLQSDIPRFGQNFGDPVANPPHLIPGNPIKLAYEAGVAAAAAKSEKTMSDAVTAFLEFKSSKVSKGQVVILRTHLAKFWCSHCGDQPIDGINGLMWERITNDINGKVKAGTWSGKYAHDVMVNIRGLYKWLWHTERIEAVPRFVSSDLYSIAIPRKLPEFFTTSELDLLFGAATPAQKLHWLICLNCGMTQLDLSDLTWSMIDLKQGTLTRQRGKHQSQTSDRIPTVVYTLWPEVKAGLSTLPQTDDRVFLNSNGKPLVGNNRNDAVAANFKLVAKSVGISKTFKVFRKTGCTLIGTAYRGWRDLYLANTSKEVVDKNYDGTTTLPAEVTNHIRSQLPKTAIS